MPPSTARCYLVGKIGSYEVPNLVRTDSCLRDLCFRLREVSRPDMAARIRADLDMLLEHRLRLQQRGHE